MDRDANYVAVGAFVLLVTAMAVSFVFWYTNLQDKHVYLRYEIYFQGTVSGLTPGSPVRYLGVDVGKVARILIDPQQRNRVLVIADIEASAPIDGRTRASLTLQGITGLLYIDLEQDRKATAPGVLAEGLHFPGHSLRTVGLRRAVEQPARIDHAPRGIGGPLQSGIQRRERAFVQSDAR